MKFTITRITTTGVVTLLTLSLTTHGFSAVTTPTTSTTTTTSNTLVPPVQPSTDAQFSTTDAYSNVQNTYGRYPITLVRGRGCTVYDDADRSYLDFVAGIATCALGHGHEGLCDAVTRQMSELHHVSNLYYIPSQAALAKWLVDNSCADRVFFCNSGAEANEGAIKLARKHAFTTRGLTDPVVITAHQSFHGRTLAAVTATGQPKYHEGFGYGKRSSGGGTAPPVPGFAYAEYNDVDDLERVFKEMNKTPWHLKMRGRKRGVAAVLLEPLQGEGGIVPGRADYFRRARSLCDKAGALLMADEVQSGMGRTGKLWAHQHLDVRPDVFTSAKALGGGVPVGAVLARGAAADVFGPGDHGSTYGGNPLACAAGLVVAEHLSRGDALGEVTARGARLRAGLEKMAERYPTVLGEVRGWGLLQGIVIRDDSATTAGELVGDAMKEGLLLVPAGKSVVRFVPPLIVTEQEIDDALDMFEKAVQKRASE